MTQQIHTAAEEEFLGESCRTYLAKWADNQVINPSDPAVPPDAPQVYVEYARKRKWLSADGKKVLGAGFKVAASYLRR